MLFPFYRLALVTTNVQLRVTQNRRIPVSILDAGIEWNQPTISIKIVSSGMSSTKPPSPLLGITALPQRTLPGPSWVWPALAPSRLCSVSMSPVVAVVAINSYFTRCCVVRTPLCCGDVKHFSCPRCTDRQDFLLSCDGFCLFSLECS